MERKLILEQAFWRWYDGQRAKEDKQRKAEKARAAAAYRQRYRAEHCQKAVESWYRLRPGDKIGNITVVSKHKYGIKGLGGARYTLSELYGRRAAGLIRQLEREAAK